MFLVLVSSLLAPPPDVLWPAAKQTKFVSVENMKKNPAALKTS